MDFRIVAEQLQKPEGEMGKQVAEKMNQTNEIMNLTTINLANPSSNDLFLEIGMGNGLFCKQILQADPTIRYTGCDFSETMIQEAIHNNPDYIHSGQARFLLSNAIHLPLEDNQFTKAFTINTIYFWSEPQKVIHELCRVLQPGGILLITIRSKEIMQHLPFVAFGFQLYTPDEVKTLLATNGFTNIQIHYTREPEQMINGQLLKMDSVVIYGTKHS